MQLRKGQRVILVNYGGLDEAWVYDHHMVNCLGKLDDVPQGDEAELQRNWLREKAGELNLVAKEQSFGMAGVFDIL